MDTGGLADRTEPPPPQEISDRPNAQEEEEEEEEEEVVEIESGGAAAGVTATADVTAAAAVPAETQTEVVNPPSAASAAAPHSSDAATPTDPAVKAKETEEKEATVADGADKHDATGTSSLAAGDSAAGTRAALVARLRPLLRPFGPLHFSLACTVVPSLVPLPPQSIYPAQPARGGYANNNAGRKRGVEESGMSVESFFAAVRPLRSLPLLHPARPVPASTYDPARIGSTMTVAAAANAVAPDAHLSDADSLARISGVQTLLSSDAFAPDTEGHRALWSVHEYFDAYRLLTHPQATDQPPSLHPPPNDAPTNAARYAAHCASLSKPAGAGRLVPLHLSPSVSFCSSHVALSLAELDLLHNIVTTPRQREADSIAAALRAPPKDMFLTFVDLSGAEGAASEFVLWKRRVCNLRAKGWAFDLSATGAPANWSAGWLNAPAREQAKNFDVYHAPAKGDATTAAATGDSPLHVRLRVMSEENVQMFMRMIDMQTRGAGVQLAIATAYGSPHAAMEPHQSSLSYRPSADVLYPTLVFQVDMALRTLAKGGTMLLQLWETHTPLTLSLIHVLYRCFEQCALHQTAGTVGYGSGQCYLICKGYHHDRLVMRPSAFPVISALTQIKQQVLLLLSLGGTGGSSAASLTSTRDWSEHGLVQPGELRANPDFVQWIRNYNRMAHAYQLHCLLSLLQATPLQSSLLDVAAPPTDGTNSSSSNSGGQTQAILPVPPPHHRIRIIMLQFLGLPVTDPFGGAR